MWDYLISIQLTFPLNFLAASVSTPNMLYHNSPCSPSTLACKRYSAAKATSRPATTSLLVVGGIQKRGKDDDNGIPN